MGKKIPPANPCTWQDFGKFIFDQREADPGYYVVKYLQESGVPMHQLQRFVVAWCAFYNLGIAARASELPGAKFYDYLRAVYPTATRASERRHFRGAAGLKAIDQWQASFKKPEEMVVFITDGAEDMGYIRKQCEGVAQMGDYFKWKWGDLYEVLNEQPLQFRGWEQVSPKVPQQGAELIAKEAGLTEFTTTGIYRGIARQMRQAGVKSYYSQGFRVFDVQDAETICCVYKQYRSGSYHPGIRTAKAYTRLMKDGQNSPTSILAAGELLARQPQPLFRNPKVLGDILLGEQIYRVEDLL